MGSCLGGSYPVGNCPVGSCPDMGGMNRGWKGNGQDSMKS